MTNTSDDGPDQKAGGKTGDKTGGKGKAGAGGPIKANDQTSGKCKAGAGDTGEAGGESVRLAQGKKMKNSTKKSMAAAAEIKGPLNKDGTPDMRFKANRGV